MPLARSSSLDRLLKCAGGDALGGQDVKSEAAKEAADWGSLVHFWKATGEVVQVGERKNHPALFRKKLERTKVTREQWWPEIAQHEVAVAINPLTAYGMLHGTPADLDAWKFSHSDDWVVGTVDTHWWMFDVLTVEDLKTGREVTFEQHEQQLLCYALGLTRALDYRGDVNVLITHWPRYPVLSLPNRFGRVVTQDELLAYERRLAKLRDDLKRLRDNGVALADLNPTDEGCLWCPSRSVCPALEMN